MQYQEDERCNVTLPECKSVTFPKAYAWTKVSADTIKVRRRGGAIDGVNLQEQ